MINSVLTGKREIPPEPPDTGFRLLERIPEKDGGTFYYEIRLKFSENISADDFDISIDKPNTALKKLVLPNMPDTLWIIPVKRWVYNMPYNLIINSTNPDKQLKKPIYIEYEFNVWPGPVGVFDEEQNNESSQTIKEK